MTNALLPSILSTSRDTNPVSVLRYVNVLVESTVVFSQCFLCDDVNCWPIRLHGKGLLVTVKPCVQSLMFACCVRDRARGHIHPEVHEQMRAFCNGRDPLCACSPQKHVQKFCEHGISFDMEKAVTHACCWTPPCEAFTRAPSSEASGHLESVFLRFFCRHGFSVFAGTRLKVPSRREPV